MSDDQLSVSNAFPSKQIGFECNFAAQILILEKEVILLLPGDILRLRYP